MNDARQRSQLSPDVLRRRLDPASLPFGTTAELEPLEGTFGQPRALDAIEFGLEVVAHGYNLFVSGAPGSGRTRTILDYLEQVASGRQPHDDWVYVFNFAEPDRPNTIRLPPGRGAELARDMDEFLKSARTEIPRAFESDDYERRRRDVLSEVGQRRDALTSELESVSEKLEFAVEMTPAGIVTLPLVKGRPLSGEDFARLPAEVQREIEHRGQELQEHVAHTMRQLRQLEKEAAERVHELDREVAQFVLGPLFHDLHERYAEESKVLDFLEQVEEDLPARLGDFRGGAEPELPAFLTGMQTVEREERLSRYRVNLFIGDHQQGGAPLVVERNPTYYNLIGRIDYRAAFGTMVTDFHQIRPGALQRANGGFLVLEALEVLRNPFAWEALKRALQLHQVRPESLGEQLSAIPTATLRPEPVDLDLKVVLIGSTPLYHLLYTLDEDFRELFKVKVDFTPEMPWSQEHVLNYARFVAREVRDSGLRHFDRAAVARVVEHGARLREHQRKLSTRLLEIADVVTEASFWAGKSGREIVAAEDVDQAIAKKEYRSNSVEERLRELIVDGVIRVETDGAQVGQVNGLSVIDLGDHAFGKPSRVSAQVSIGRGSLVSIEREIELSGPIHSKGFMILSGYLAGQYAQELPLALSATLTFEQAYEGVEGDSASSTELYALLSALSGLPLRQGIAVTGSVDQHGRVQAVGGVTTKIEGFFAVCKEQGLTGKQGVAIPKTNIESLMLNDDVVEAARAGSFSIWAIETIDEGIELLTGVPAGVRGADGAFAEGTVHALVEQRLRGYAELLREFARAGESAEDD